MAKFKIQAGAEIDLLSKDEVQGAIDSSFASHELFLSEGIRYSKASVNNITTLSNLLSAPVFTSATPVGSGGTFAAGTYFYVATNTTPFGETTKSNEVSATVVLNGSVNLVVQNNSNYPTKIYRGTATGAENVLVTTLASGVTTFTDTNVGSAGTVPSTNTAYTQTLPTTPNWNQGWVQLCQPEPGFVWNIMAIVPAFANNNSATLPNAGYMIGGLELSNLVAPIQGAGSVPIPLGGANTHIILMPSTPLYVGFYHATQQLTAPMTINIFYKEVPLSDIGKL